MKIVPSEAIDWAAPVAAIALCWVLNQFLFPGVAIAITALTFVTWRGWRKRRDDPEAARAFLIDSGGGIVIAWGVAWTLVLFIHPAAAVFLGFGALGLFKWWREERTGRISA